jgi:hypothetical protein
VSGSLDVEPTVKGGLTAVLIARLYLAAAARLRDFSLPRLGRLAQPVLEYRAHWVQNLNIDLTRHYSQLFESGLQTSRRCRAVDSVEARYLCRINECQAPPGRDPIRRPRLISGSTLEYLMI